MSTLAGCPGLAVSTAAHRPGCADLLCTPPSSYRPPSFWNLPLLLLLQFLNCLGLSVAFSCTTLDSSDLIRFPRHLELMQRVGGML